MTSNLMPLSANVAYAIKNWKKASKMVAFVVSLNIVDPATGLHLLDIGYALIL